MTSNEELAFAEAKFKIVAKGCEAYARLESESYYFNLDLGDKRMAVLDVYEEVVAILLGITDYEAHVLFAKAYEEAGDDK